MALSATDLLVPRDLIVRGKFVVMIIMREVTFESIIL